MAVPIIPYSSDEAPLPKQDASHTALPPTIGASVRALLAILNVTVPVAVYGEIVAVKTNRLSHNRRIYAGAKGHCRRALHRLYLHLRNTGIICAIAAVMGCDVMRADR